LANYAQTFSTTIKTFCDQGPDNKLALQNTLTAGVVGVRIGAYDAQFAFEDGKLWLQTKPNYWNSYLSEFNAVNLTKILVFDDFPLETHKNLKAAQKKIDDSIAKANNSLGQEFTWEECNKEVYDALVSYGKTASQLEKLGDEIANYATTFATTIAAFSKDQANKEQFLSEVSSSVVTIRIDNDVDKPFVITDGKLVMQTKPNYWNSYLSEFSQQNLEKILGGNDSIPLICRKNLENSKKNIDATMAKISKIYGQDLTWEDNNQAIFDELKTYGKTDDQLNKLGDEINNYATQLLKELTIFCKDADNVEQLKEEVSSGVILLRIDTNSASNWIIEDGKLIMESKPNYWNSYLSEFTAVALEKKLGVGNSIPLVAKKNLKKNLKLIEANMEKVKKLFGNDVTWEDPSEEVYSALSTYGKTADNLYTIGDNLKAYTDQFVKELTIFLKDADNKEQLANEWSTGVLLLQVVDDAVPWKLDGGKLLMQSKPNYWNSYLSEFTAGALEKILGLEDPMPLIVRKNVKKNQKLIEAQMTKVSKVYGQELTWADNAQELYEARKAYGASETDQYTLGDAILTYVAQFVKEITIFAKDKDNLEALQEEVAGAQIGVRIKDDAAAKSWAIDSGNLWMETKANYWKSYLSEFTASKLESIL